VDCDGNGYIDYSEFILAAVNERVLLSKSNLERAFRSLDCDNSGKISLQEMKGMMGMGVEGNERVWAKLVQEADMDGDGEINLAEFTRLMLEQTFL
jgi:calcium-dependent protein kinase